MKSEWEEKFDLKVSAIEFNQIKRKKTKISSCIV